MYSNKLVVALKQNGKILRECSGTVFLPFGSEYSLLVKNLNSRKASVNIFIDGKDVLSNKSLLIRPNSEIELEGFIDGMTAKNKFRFIQKTKEISDYRGDRIDDGLIRVEFAFEKRKPEVVHHIYEYHNYDYWRSWKPWTLDDTKPWYTDSTSCVADCKKCYSFNNNIVNDSLGLCNSAKFNDNGITVKGSEISQDFTYGSIGELGQSHVMIIKLRGKKDNGTVIKIPITVKTKLVCPTCGKKSRSDSKYCSRCGTYLG